MTPAINTISLYALHASQPSGAETLQTSSVSSLLAISHSIEETVLHHGLNGIFFAGFQRFSAFLPQADRFQRLASRCKKVYVFGVQDCPVPSIPNIEFVALEENAPLTREWFIIFAHPRYEIALLTREVGSSALSVSQSRFGRGRLYQGLVSLEDHLVEPAARLLHQALGLPAPAVFPAPNIPASPINTHIHRFAGYMERAQSQLAALNQNLADRTASLERMESIVRTMVSRRAWDDSMQMLETQTENIQPKRQTLSILFTDIESFTPLFAREDSSVLTEILNRYFNLISVVIYEHHGDVDKFLGDGMMAFFTDPESAIRAAEEIQKRLAQFNRQQIAHLSIQLNTRIGIATGECVITRLGSAARREITIIGDAVNLASRLQSLAPVNGLSVDEVTYRAVRNPAHFIGRDVNVKGKGSQRMYSADFQTLTEESFIP
jgi:class 3 adenylate cyclase/DICT domain-containing protein